MEKTLQFSIIFFFIFGAFYEGIRMQQSLYAVVFVMVQGMLFFTHSIITSILLIAVISFGLYTIIVFGAGNLSKLVFTGPFKVGFKEFRTK